MKRSHGFLLLLGWMLVIFMLSSEVSGVSSGRSDTIVNLLTSSLHLNLSQEFLTFLTRKTAHIIAYFILGILIFNVVKTYRLRVHNAIFASIGFALVYAASDEFHQLFVPGRSGELRDILIDTTAATIGILLFSFIHKRRKNSFKSNNNV